ncbi:MAG: 5-oxoprolinase subunit PxpA [Polyangiaceae bacterium]
MSPFLNIDAGESDAEPEELYRCADRVNVACGGHAGDERSMQRVLTLCKAFGTAVGAHPSYPDRPGFGRVSMTMDPAELASSVAEQAAALARVAEQIGLRVTSMKPHGALYHDANGERAIAESVLGGAIDALGTGLLVIGPPLGFLRDVARERGLDFAREVFADRGVRDGALIERGQPGALIDDPDEAEANARRLLKQGDFETICVHGDTPHAVAIARAVRAAMRPET